MNKSVGNSKVITDAKWNKGMEELTIVKDASQLDIENDIAIWEVAADIKAFPFEDSDQAQEKLAYEKQKQSEKEEFKMSLP